jgi:hypothetical protein
MLSKFSLDFFWDLYEFLQILEGGGPPIW